jgi:hypothetical protein
VPELDKAELIRFKAPVQIIGPWPSCSRLSSIVAPPASASSEASS